MSQFDTQVNHKLKLTVKAFVQISHDDDTPIDTVKLTCRNAVMNRGQVAMLREMLTDVLEKMGA